MATSRNKERSFVTVINPTAASFNSFLHSEPKETKEEPLVLDAPKRDLDVALTPEQIVVELDKHIIGQADAKRAVSLALRNRWRRKMLPADLRQEVHPMNILMAGPTGSGKTEIARRLAKLAQAPFVKVEATRYTEVGYVGSDTSSMIKDLADAAFTMIMDQKRLLVKDQAKRAAEDVSGDVKAAGEEVATASKKAGDQAAADVNKAADQASASAKKAGDEMTHGQPTIASTKEYEKASQKLQKRYDELTKLSGEKFDKEYLSDVASNNMKAIKLVEKQSKSGWDSDLTTWASETLPTLRHHEELIKGAREDLKTNRPSM